MKSCTISFLSVVFITTNIQASSILFFHLTCTASHRISIWPFVEKLADSGHNVTYIFPLSQQAGYHAQVEEIRPRKLVELVEPLLANFDINIRPNNSVSQSIAHAVSKVPQFCEAFYDSSETQEWLSRPNIKYEKNRNARKELPMSDAKDGFIYVSFGSAVNVSGMPTALRNEFFRAFESFPDLKILWRWEGPIPKHVPRNVFLHSWFPQLDLLAHPNIRTFIMQAGRPSSQEALCYGVPMIAIPMITEQESNAFRLVYTKVALLLDISVLTARELKEAIQQVAYTDKFSKRAKELSQMFRDRPIDPLEQAHYWVENVLRHNTALLRPLAIQQTWWQRRLLDVYAFLLAIIIFIALLSYSVLKWVICRCCCCFAKRSEQKIKTS